MSTIEATTDSTTQLFGHRRSTALEVASALLKQPAGQIGILITLLIVGSALAAPLLPLHDPIKADPTNLLTDPNSANWLGTDEVGRDVFSRLVYGARPALAVGTLAVLIGGLLGIGLGIAAGYYRGPLEASIMRVFDVLFAFPLILVGVCAVVVLGPGPVSVGLAVGIGATPMFARLARAETLEEMGRDFVKASRGMGGSDVWIMLRHVLPNITASIVVQMATAISAAVVLASALDFLGLGTKKPDPSWGTMLQESRAYLAVSPIFALAPGIALTAFVIAVNMVAAALTNALNPRIRTKLLRRSRADSERTSSTSLVAAEEPA
jgi:peptide/nickel transport system permease protein